MGGALRISKNQHITKMPREGHFYLLSFCCCFFILDNLIKINMIGTIIITDEPAATAMRQVSCFSIPLMILFTLTIIIPTKMTMMSINNVFGDAIF